MFVPQDPLGHPANRQAPVEPSPLSRVPRQARLSTTKYTDDVTALVRRQRTTCRYDTGRRPPSPCCGANRARRPGVLGRLLKSPGHSFHINLPRTLVAARGDVSSGSHPVDSHGHRLSNAIEREKTAPVPYFQVAAARARSTSSSQSRSAEIRSGAGRKTCESFSVPDDLHTLRRTEAVRVALSQPHVYTGTGRSRTTTRIPPTPWNGTSGRLLDSGALMRTRCRTPDLRGNPPDRLRGIDIITGGRSFDPSCPVGVHMYLGGAAGSSHDALAHWHHAGDLT